MKISIPTDIRQLMEQLQRYGFECWVTGGAVRSALLNLPVHDYDLSTSALPEQTKQVFADYRIIETGIRHGTVTVLFKGQPVEITTFRKESVYGDHRHPDHVQFTSAVREDCARRDFTVNAFCAGTDGEVLDFFNGLDDLKNRTIRCIGSPDERFNEDALRILRAVRFAARLSFSIEEETSIALHKNKELLRFISMERIHDELNGLLKAPGCKEMLCEYRDIFEVLIPELHNLTERQWQSVLDAIERAPDEALVRVALLLSLCEKPEEILKRLKCSNSEIKAVMAMISSAERPIETEADMRRAIRDYSEHVLSVIDFRCALDPCLDKEKLVRTYSLILERNDVCTIRQLAVNGNDLKEAGLSGKQISDTLKELLEEVIEKRLNNSRHDLLAYITMKMK